MFEPLVSVIMPCLNGAKTISLAIESVCNQTYKNIELIIIDDGSNDSSIQIIESFIITDPRIKILFNKKNGVAYARNLGLSIAKGKYICFLDSDDYYYNESISVRVNFALANNLKLVFGSYERLLPNGKLSKITAPQIVSYDDMLKRNYIGNLTGFYDAEFFGKILQKNIRHEDYLMWCTMLRSVDYGRSVGSCPLGVYRVSTSSLSGNKIKALYWHWQVLRKGLNIRLAVAIYYQFYYMYVSLVDRVVSKWTVPSSPRH